MNSMKTAPALDRQALLRRFGGQPAIVERVLGEFLRELPVTLAELEAACASGDVEQARQAAHKMAGGLRTLCALPAAAVAGELEEAVRTDLDRAQTLLPSLREELIALRVAVLGEDEA